MQLAPYGSIEDRVMREMVFRERQERVSHVDAIAKMIARVFNVDAGKAFGGIVAEYAAEVFQETYDPEVLKRKVDRRRAAQAEIVAKREHDERLIERLNRMGEFYDRQNPKNAK
jgi:hypothetical protein